MSIYAILASKPHNPHYLKRYISFIESCKQVNEDFGCYTEKHHICPKALFPEYKSFTKNPWNKVLLTARQHFIAHWMLWKAYPDDKSMMFAFYSMNNTMNMKPSSRVYHKLRTEHNEAISSIASTNNKKRVEDGTHQFLGGEIQRKRVKNGTHHFLGGEIQRNNNKKRVENGTHNLLGPETNRKRVENGTHPWLSGEIQRKTQRKRVEDGTHNWLDREAARERELKKVKEGTHHFLDKKAASERSKKRVEDGTHNWLGGELVRKRVEDGTHNLLGMVPCCNKQGVRINISKEVYYKQTGPIEDREYVHFNTREGKRRRGLLSS